MGNKMEYLLESKCWPLGIFNDIHLFPIFPFSYELFFKAAQYT